MSDEPQELPGDPARQAVSSITGTVYQAWASIEAWLQLKGPDEVIYVEGAEDFDLVESGAARTVQVKNRKEAISLASREAQAALGNYWSLTCNAPGRRIDMHYLTTSGVACERGSPFDGMAGIHAWRVGRTNRDIAQRLTRYLVQALPKDAELTAFLQSAPLNEIQERLYGRFHWFTEQPDLDALKASVLSRIISQLSFARLPLSSRHAVQDRIESRFWEIVIRKDSAARLLTHGDLQLQVEEATTVNVPVRVHQLQGLLNAPLSSGQALLSHLISRPTVPPSPLLRRPELVERVRGCISSRQSVALVGTIHKGKTTTAQLVVMDACPDAWALRFTGRRPEQVDAVLGALLERIEAPGCPAVIVFDDFDLGPQALAVYRDSLVLLLYRLRSSGRAALIAAQGSQPGTALSLPNLEVIDVPELAAEQIAVLCEELGCATVYSQSWSRVIRATTGGHPKLVHVRLIELQRDQWPRPTPADFFAGSTGMADAKQMARSLLNAKEDASVAEFLYAAAELTFPMDRQLALLLAESLDEIKNPGDVIDRLTGQWLEPVDGSFLRTTQLLQGSGLVVWSTRRWREMQAHLHDVIELKRTLSEVEAAGMLYHAFVSGDRFRMAKTAMTLAVSVDKEAEKAVFEQLVWLPIVALEPKQTFVDDPFAEASMRCLQFRVAQQLDDVQLDRIAARWADAVEETSLEEVKVTAQTVIWAVLGQCSSEKLSLATRLIAIAGMRTLENSQHAAPRAFKPLSSGVDGVPVGTGPSDMMFAAASAFINDMDSFRALLHWLEHVADDVGRQQLERVIVWPFVQRSGAFIHNAWMSRHEETQDWEPWLEVLQDGLHYAKTFGSPNFGREVAKSMAIVLTEYLNRSWDALSVLANAAREFGASAMLLEQEVNVRYQSGDDAGAMAAWQLLAAHTDATSALSAYSFRRAGICAARLGRIEEAASLFQAGADSISSERYAITKFGLRADAANALFMTRNYGGAAGLLHGAVVDLPQVASAEGCVKWEAVLRSAAFLSRSIEAGWKKDMKCPREPIAPGHLSTAGLAMSQCEAGQAVRSTILLLESTELAASLGVLAGPTEPYEFQAVPCTTPYVRLLAARANLAKRFALRSHAGIAAAILELEFAHRVIAEVGVEGGMREISALPELNIRPDALTGLFVAGLCCASSPPHESLRGWAAEIASFVNVQMGVETLMLSAADRVSSRSRNELEGVCDSAGEPGLVRCAAAIAVLNQKPEVGRTWQLQALLASGCVSDLSHQSQEVFNLHLAVRFSEVWIDFMKAPFRLSNPRRTLPALERVCYELHSGRATLKDLLVASAAAAGCTLPSGDSFMDRLW